MPSKNFIEKTLIFENIPAGDQTFFDKNAKIDFKFLEENKIFDRQHYDLIIELEALKENGEIECNLVCCSKIIPENHNNKNDFKIKTEGQKLIVKNIWFEMHDIYGFNSDNNS